MHCPSCRMPMEASPFVNHIGHPVEIDVCWPCHLIWFDGQESTTLSIDSVVDLFRRIHAHRSDVRNIVALQPGCPRCDSGLNRVQDLVRGGRFHYLRCPRGDGRLISFVQFLREKNFVRSLNGAEVARLAATVQQVRCSSCGAPIRLASDSACTHCGAAIDVLDSAAVDKALAEYDARRRPAPPSARPSTPIVQRSADPLDLTGWQEPASDIADLLLVGLNAVMDALHD